jgi:hypothetical protein
MNDYILVVAEDGNLYPYAKEEYSVLLAAGKTVDALWFPSVPGTYPVSDRALHLTTAGASGGGLVAQLQVADGTPPEATDDAYAVAEDTVGGLTVAAPGVLGNDNPSTGLTTTLVSTTTSGSLALNADGSFTYIPNANFSGADSFSYKASNGTLASNVATVRLTVTAVNDAPVAANDAYSVALNRVLSVGAPGVLANDTDVDRDPLTAVLQSGPASGSLTLNPDGSFNFLPAVQGVVNFSYTANDAAGSSAPATVTITVGPAINLAPVATDDFAATNKNTAVSINLIGNDYDPDPAGTPEGTLNPASIVITTKPSKGGKVVVNANGSVTYTPKRNYRGTEVFYYTVKDSAAAPLTSNAAKVTVNVR